VFLLNPSSEWQLSRDYTILSPIYQVNDFYNQAYSRNIVLLLPVQNLITNKVSYPQLTFHARVQILTRETGEGIM
jgi:hypothetical protein